MSEVTKFVGLDVHKETIVVAVADRTGGEARTVGTFKNEPRVVAKLVKQLGRAEELHCCYEAGPTGYGLHRQLSRLGATCWVIVPTLIPTKPGDKVKTDRRDALKLARLLRSGELTACWVPTEAYEAFRNLTRERSAASQDQRRARQRLGQLLLRLGVAPAARMTRWGPRHRAWLQGLRLEQPMNQDVLGSQLRALDQATERLAGLTEAVAAAAAASEFATLIKALACLYGVGLVTAATEVAEIGDFRRFAGPRSLFNYLGMTPREDSSGPRVRRGSITKAGNRHARWVLIEAAWHFTHPPKVGRELAKRRAGQDPAIIAIADRAHARLYRRYWRLIKRGKLSQQAVVAVARELAGFLWAIAWELARLEAERRTAAAAEVAVA